MTRIRSLLIRYRSPSLAAGACLLVVTLAACSSSPPLFLRDGRSTQQVQCSAAGDRDACVQQARAQCGGSYDTVDESNSGGIHTLVFACHAH